MSTIAQAVDRLLAGLLLTATRLLWIHGLFKMVVNGLAPVCRLPADCTAMDRIRCAGSKQAGIVLILKSGDKGRYWKGGALCGDRVATKIADNCGHNGAVCRRCVRFAGKRRRAADRCDRREGNSLAESYV